MKNLFALIVIVALFVSCSESPTVGGSGQGRIAVEAFDAAACEQSWARTLDFLAKHL